MTPKGAAMLIDDIEMRLFQIEDHQARLREEREQLLKRHAELVLIRDKDKPIEPDPIFSIG